MTIVAESLPGLKTFLRCCKLKRTAHAMVLRLMACFLLHYGRMSCLQAAGTIRSSVRHRAQIGRFLMRNKALVQDSSRTLRAQMLANHAHTQGLYIFILDAVDCAGQGKKSENTFRVSNGSRRPRRGRRYGQHKHARKSFHSFLIGLLLTPKGVRIPFYRPHCTKEYCTRHQLPHRTLAELAAELIRELSLPAGAEVIVLGDTSFDAAIVHQACARKQYTWIVPCNPERVFAGPQGNRPRVRAVIEDWSALSQQTIRLTSERRTYDSYKRLSPTRSGPNTNVRTYYVHREKRAVHSVGEVQLVFSTKQQKLKQATANDVKILMTNNPRLTPREIVELYSIRWQIELFFKELKSTLGFDQYRCRSFDAVNAWVELALMTFLYLEWYRAKQLAKRGLTAEQKKLWCCQRTHGLCLAIRNATDERELLLIAERLKTPGGMRKLKRLLRNCFPAEYRLTT